MAVGREWLGAEHPAVRCLAIGVAIHHGRLPGPFLREVETLLAAGVLRVTVASPTLAQGLNLNAAVLLIPNLYRAGTLITGEEFANVAGRAGRIRGSRRTRDPRNASARKLAPPAMERVGHVGQGSVTLKRHYCRGQRGHTAPRDVGCFCAWGCHGLPV